MDMRRLHSPVRPFDRSQARPRMVVERVGRAGRIDVVLWLRRGCGFVRLAKWPPNASAYERAGRIDVVLWLRRGCGFVRLAKWPPNASAYERAGRIEVVGSGPSAS